MKYLVTDIEWDVDHKEDLQRLPEVMVVEAEEEDDIADIISDKTGYCHKGFSVEEIKTDRLFVYDKNIITIVYDNYGADDRNLGDLLDWLGDEASIVQTNELYQFCCADDSGNLFNFDNQDEEILARKGFVELTLTGETVEDYKETNKDFYNWFFSGCVKN